MDNFELRIKGFKSKVQVEAFISWYEGQGEQDASVWFECRKEEGDIDVDSMPVDVSIPLVWNENTLTAHLKID
jgi:hypothetical protein